MYTPLYVDSQIVPSEYAVKIRSTACTKLVVKANMNGVGGSYLLSTMFTLIKSSNEHGVMYENNSVSCI